MSCNSKKIKRTLLLDYQIISFYNHVTRIFSCSVFCLKREHTYINQKLVVMALLSLYLSSSVQISLISEQRNLHLHLRMHMLTPNYLHSYQTQSNNNLNKN